MANDWVSGAAIIASFDLRDFELNNLVKEGILESFDPLTGKGYINEHMLEKRVKYTLEECLQNQQAKQHATTCTTTPLTECELKQRATDIFNRQKPMDIIPEGRIPVSFEISIAVIARNRRALFKCKETVKILLEQGFQPIQIQPSCSVAPEKLETGHTDEMPIAEVQNTPVVDMRSPTAIAPTGLPAGIFPASTATEWKQVHVKFVGPYAIEIHCSGNAENKTFDEIGFSDKRRRDEPNSQWSLLRIIAENRGEINPNDDISKKISDLRKSLRSVFPHLKGNPIRHESERRAYITTFTISSSIPHA